jgi:hypothetical protein
MTDNRVGGLFWTGYLMLLCLVVWAVTKACG